MENNYIITPFNYTGSKYKMLNQLLPHFDYTKNNFVDLFCGGGSVWCNILSEYKKVLANDIIEDLINIQKSLLKSDNIIKKTIELCPEKGDKEGFLKLRESYNKNKTPEKLWALMLCSTNNMLRFNKKFLYNQTYGNRRWNSSTDNKVKIFTEHIRKYKEKIHFTYKSFFDIPPKQI